MAADNTADDEEATTAGVATLEAVRAAARSDPAATLVALDFDGTLAPLVPDPATSALLPGMADALSNLGTAGVRVAIVTGRAPDVVLDLSGLRGRAGLDRLQVAGLYGLQILNAATGGIDTTVDDATLAEVDAVRDELPGLLRDAPAGVHLEDKGIALVVHTRPAADPQQALDDLVGDVRALAERRGLVFEPGRFAAEIRPGGSDKGATLARLVSDADPPISTVLYAGDDTGDLPALRMIAALRGRGLTAVGIAVAQDGTDPAVLAAADARVAGPTGVLDLLRGLLAGSLR